MYGTQPIALPTTYNMTKFPAVDDQLNSIRRYQREASATHELAQNRMASCIKTDFVPFKEGNKVWLEATNLNLGHNRKLASKREGPFKITEVLGPSPRAAKPMANPWCISCGAPFSIHRNRRTWTGIY